MKNKLAAPIPSFLKEDVPNLEYSLFKVNLILNAYGENRKPYTIDYHTLMMSYYLWGGSNLEEFCHKQALSYFLLNPLYDSAEAREAFSLEIREFLSGT